MTTLNLGYVLEFTRNESVASCIDIDMLLARAGLQACDHLVVSIEAGRILEGAELNGFDSPEAVMCSLICREATHGSKGVICRGGKFSATHWISTS